jgi:hypothetical protein
VYATEEEEFYPPDHHMHSSNRAAGEAPAAPAGDPPENAQGELDLTSRRDPDPAKTP